MEPRARASRHKGQLNFGEDLKNLLFAYGAPTPPDIDPTNEKPEPYPETLRVLDEMLTDFIIEMCHNAVSSASYSGRQKLKVDDFRFALRRDPVKLGRLQQMYLTGKDINRDKKAFDALGIGGGGGGAAGGLGGVGMLGAGGVGGPGREAGEKVGVGALETFAEMGGEEGTARGKGRGRKRKRKAAVSQVDGSGEWDGEDGAASSVVHKAARSEGG